MCNESILNYLFYLQTQNARDRLRKRWKEGVIEEKKESVHEREKVQVKITAGLTQGNTALTEVLKASSETAFATSAGSEFQSLMVWGKKVEA